MTFGLIGASRADSGPRDAVIGLMKSGFATMPGCICFMAGTDSTDRDLICIGEIWETKDASRGPGEDK